MSEDPMNSIQSPTIPQDDSNIIYYAATQNRNRQDFDKIYLQINSYNKISGDKTNHSLLLPGCFLSSISAGKWGLIIQCFASYGHVLLLCNQTQQTLPQLNSSYQLVLAYAQDKLFCFSGQLLPYYTLNELVHEPAFKYYDFKSGQWIRFQSFVNGYLIGPTCTVDDQSIFARYLQQDKCTLVKFDIQRQAYDVLKIESFSFQDLQMFGYENNLFLISDRRLQRYDIETENKIEESCINLDWRLITYENSKVYFRGLNSNIFCVDFMRKQ